MLVLIRAKLDWGESYRTQGSKVPAMRNWNDFGFPSASDNVLPYLLVYVGIRKSVFCSDFCCGLHSSRGSNCNHERPQSASKHLVDLARLSNFV